MNLDKALWYVNRLRSMRKREFLHRVHEAVELRRQEKPAINAAIPSLKKFESTCPRLLDVWTVVLDETPALYCRSQADAAMGGAISVFGESWSTRAKQWNVDPVSGYEWPSLPAHQIDYRHSSGADPKWTWEVNRLLFLVPVAFLVESGDVDRPAGEKMIVETLSDWIENNRPGYGPQWAASIEVAIRAISMTISIQAVKSADDNFHEIVGRAVANHARWIKRFPSLYSSANNHRIAEISALLLLGASWEGVLDEAEMHSLEAELVVVSRTLFSADGIGLEQSPTYAGFSLEFLALVLHSYRFIDEVSRVALQRVVSDAAFAMAQFTNEDGSLIRYGDDDEGKVVTVAVADNEYSSALIRMATGQRLPRENGITTFADGGISLMRFTDASLETTWTLDHGPLGFGEIAAHGHADALAVSMRSGGIDWIVDAGTYRYHGDKRWRTYFRSSAAHNAPQLNNQDSSVMTGDFNWHPHKRAQAQLLFAQANGELFLLRATHDGYSRQGLGSVFRTIERRGEGVYRVTDSHDAMEEMTTGFLVNHECDVLQVKDGWRITHPKSTLEVRLSVSGHSHINTESPAAESAWFSPSFGRKVPTWRLVSSAKGEKPGRELAFDFVLLVPSQQEA